MAGWDSLHDLVREEIEQARSEGLVVDGLIEQLDAAGEDVIALERISSELMTRPTDPGFEFVEPDELDEIREHASGAPDAMRVRPDETSMSNRLFGAWLGRSIGCVLGKPLECGPFMFGSDGRPGWLNVEDWFRGADAWPIRGYTPSSSRAKEKLNIDLNWEFAAESVRERIQYVQSDDDLRYTILGLLLLEERGLEWDTWDVGQNWHSRLAFYQVATAENKAYHNFAELSQYKAARRPDDWRRLLHAVSRRHNPYREWIGAQIRVDPLAYVAAGDPLLASELAWRDATFSHVKNGVYSAMFCAALIAAAFVEPDVEQIVSQGLSIVPARSRLAAALASAVDIGRAAATPTDLAEQLWERFAEMHPVHAINNACVVAAALLYSRGDFETGITAAVGCGWDTDCNGATVGSVLGARAGAAKLPDRWATPLNDTLYAEVPGFHPVAISTCADRTYRIWKELDR